MQHQRAWKPTRQQLLDARNKTVPDIIDKDLSILFCGINPSLYTAAIGHHFGRPGNRFWPSIYKSGISSQLLSPFDEHRLIDFHCGITNLVDRATAQASELSESELADGVSRLIKKVTRYTPRSLAILGIDAYKKGFGEKNISVGLQDKKIGLSDLWVLPNPSGLNASYQIDTIVEYLKLMRERYFPDSRET